MTSTDSKIIIQLLLRNGIDVSRNLKESEVCNMNNKVTNMMNTKIEYACKRYVQRTYGITSSCPR